MIKNVLVLGGGLWQIPLITFLKDKGCNVFVADPYDFSPGVKYANIHVKEDIRNGEALFKKVEHLKLDAVISDQSDIAVDSVAYLTSKFGLIGNTQKVVKRFSNKFISREFAKNLNIPVPTFKKIKSFDDLRKFYNQINKPLIIKPVDAQSSRGVFIVSDLDVNEINNKLKESFIHSKEDYVIAESFFEGIEITIEGICSGSKHRSVAISRKKHLRTGIASDLIYPAEIEDKILHKIIKDNDLFVEKSGLKFGITHAEYLINFDSGEYILVEIACRGGGSLVSSDIAKWVSGLDLYDILFKELNGVSSDVKSFKLKGNAATLHFFEFENGKVETIDGLDEINSMKGVHYFKLDFVKGDIIKSATDDRSRQGLIIVFAQTREQVAEILKKVNTTLNIKIQPERALC